MSKMLEQAIIDAEELKQTAMKIAEQTIIEKYSEEMKRKMDILLEEMSDPFSTTPNLNPGFSANSMEDQLPVGGNMEFSSDITNQVSLGGTSDIDNASNGENEEVEIDFELLQKQLEDEKSFQEEENLPSVNVKFSSSSGRSNLQDSEEDKEIELDFEDDQQQDSILEEIEGTHQEPDGDECDDCEGDDGATLTINSEVEPNGYGNQDMTNQKHNISKKELSDLFGDSQEDDGNRRIVAKLKESKKQIEKLKKDKLELKEKLESLAETINKTNLINAKLLYVNKILQDCSLNEQQKLLATQKIADANSGREAKLIYETLVTTTGERKKKSPESLFELKSKNQPKFSQKSRSESDVSKQDDDTLAKEWKRLAGIK